MKRLSYDLYRVLGYGRSVGRPLALCLAVLVGWGCIRTAKALVQRGGALELTRHAIHIDWWSTFRLSVDLGLTLLMAPLTIASGLPDNTALLGMSGGYLLAMKGLITLLLVAAVAAFLHRVRVRPNLER